MALRPLCSLCRVSVRSNKQGVHCASKHFGNPNNQAFRSDSQHWFLAWLSCWKEKEWKQRPLLPAQTPAGMDTTVCLLRAHTGSQSWSWKRQLDFITALKISPSCAHIGMDWNTAPVRENSLFQKSIVTSSSTADSFPSLSTCFQPSLLTYFTLFPLQIYQVPAFNHSFFSTRLKSCFLPVKMFFSL